MLLFSICLLGGGVSVAGGEDAFVLAPVGQKAAQALSRLVCSALYDAPGVCLDRCGCGIAVSTTSLLLPKPLTTSGYSRRTKVSGTGALTLKARVQATF
jgi:hypothetical protein